jgi:hypothetical protein
LAASAFRSALILARALPLGGNGRSLRIKTVRSFLANEPISVKNLLQICFICVNPEGFKRGVFDAD